MYSKSTARDLQSCRYHCNVYIQSFRDQITVHCTVYLTTSKYCCTAPERRSRIILHAKPNTVICSVRSTHPSTAGVTVNVKRQAERQRGARTAPAAMPTVAPARAESAGRRLYTESERGRTRHATSASFRVLPDRRTSGRLFRASTAPHK